MFFELSSDEDLFCKQSIKTYSEAAQRSKQQKCTSITTLLKRNMIAMSNW